MASGPAQTTLPSNETLQGSGEGEVLAIRWLFPERQGLLTRLTQPRILLGRSDECDVRLEGTETSRVHAEIRREGMLFYVRDLKSRNGVFVNGKAITEAPLAPGQVVRLGEWIGALVLNARSAPADDQSAVYSLIAPGLAGGPILAPILAELERAAKSNLPIVLLGETGTGKEGCSRAIHAWSGRSGAMVAVNCAALPSGLAEAELFGYRKGAFTGADRSHSGYFRAAKQGSLLLDEVTDLPLELQGKLLRVLEQNEVQPLGESTPVPIDVRVIAATQVPLAQAVAERKFRPDLCARLDGLTVTLPPLRARKEETPYLFLHLLALHSGGRPPQVEPRLIEQLCLYDWPYNVRELDLLVRRLLVLHAHEGLLRRSHLPEHVLRDDGLTAQVSSGGDNTHGRRLATTVNDSKRAVPYTPEAYRERRERELKSLLAALREHRGNVARAAAAVGISRQRAYRLMEPTDASGQSADVEDEAEN